MFDKAFSQLFPIAFLGANNYLFVRSSWQMCSFLESKEVMKRSGPKQNKIDELCTIELPQPKIDDYEKQRNCHWRGKDTVVVASRVNAEYAVLRWFQKDMLNKKVYETSRLFVSKKDIYFCRINSFGEFIYINGKLNAHNFRAADFIVESEDAFKGTKLEYFQSCIDDVRDDQRSLLLWLFCYYPIAEKMWKMPEYKMVPFNFVTKHTWGKFDEFLWRYFGYVDINAKNINKALGINSYQAKKMMTETNFDAYVSNNPVRVLKRGLELSDISFIDNDTFDALCKLVKHMKCRSYYLEEIFSILYKNYSFKGMVRIAEDFDKLDLKSIDVATINLYMDYIRMADKLNDTTNFKPYFKTKADIKEMHDAVMVIYDLKRNAVKVEAFNKHSSRWRKWEYNKNATFTVIAPTIPNDLAKEGMTLHHCVKSYIDRVAEGRTNIMFIRKNDALEEPFFTVEVSNEGTVEQVHGFGNRNANTEPGLEEFVSEWAKACKLKAGGYNKIR
jgi:hypothetical protein